MVAWTLGTGRDRYGKMDGQTSLIRYAWPNNIEQSVLRFANPNDVSKRIRTTVRANFDEGKTWPASRVIDAGSSGYTCLTRLTVVVLG